MEILEIQDKTKDNPVFKENIVSIVNSFICNIKNFISFVKETRIIKKTQHI